MHNIFAIVSASSRLEPQMAQTKSTVAAGTFAAGAAFLLAAGAVLTAELRRGGQAAQLDESSGQVNV
jgi:hypothetical protein